MDYEAIRDLPQFELRHFEVINNSLMIRDKLFSVGRVRFYLHRHFGYFLINFYVPCTLIVLLAWVALWINREATSDRIGLGITSVLTMTFLALDSRSDSPRVNFPTALDVYILFNTADLLICICEFTIVHYYTKNSIQPILSYKEPKRNVSGACSKKFPRKLCSAVAITIGDGNNEATAWNT
uniref:Gamma-aminobutyric acid receptor alpha-like protein n=1 Tax=Ascaris suum TaxID=6253 RepID=F1LDR3_ASCSU